MSRFVFYDADEVALTAARAELAALRFQRAALYLAIALKQNFNPSQPRVPARNPDGGQWTRVGGGAPAMQRQNFRETIVPAHPKSANVDDNIRLAESIKAALEPSLRMLWFYNQVRNKGPWDYKQLHRDFADFGNFNYGATGAALGFSETILLRAAGWTQSRSGNSGSGEPANALGVILGTGGSPPFGDDPKDQGWIRRGMQYYRVKLGR